MLEKCTRYFSKKNVENTTFDVDGYPLYKKRDTRQIIKKGDYVIDNRYLVSHNRYLLLKYNAHINVDWCNLSGVKRSASVPICTSSI